MCFNDQDYDNDTTLNRVPLKSNIKEGWINNKNKEKLWGRKKGSLKNFHS